MINLLIGPPGGGKSYEATVFHVLKALNSGRRVITNLPLNIDRFEQLGVDTSLIEIRKHTLAVKPATPEYDEPESLWKLHPPRWANSPTFVDRPFANVEDYADSWRCPSTGAGPLYVVDECHMALPRGATSIAVEDWYALHRHESADVLLITQSYGKVSKSIIDLVQVCYRVKKATAFGSDAKYIRKVQDGVRGEVVNTSIRAYEKKYFDLYKSHTRGGGQELGAEDIIPIWRRWPFIGLALCVFLFFAILLTSDVSINPLKNGVKQSAEQPPVPVRVVETINGQVVSDTAKPTAGENIPQDKTEPFGGRGFHVVGSVSGKKNTRHLFAVSQNGQVVSTVETADLLALGYIVEAPIPCAVRLEWHGQSRWVICDAPVQTVTPPSTQANS